MKSRMPQPSAPAVVVGLCSHGLAIVRALASQGVRVHALEARPELPGNRTALGTVHTVPAITGPGLIESLIAVRRQIKGTEPPVLFLTNDGMVANVAEAWPDLQDQYRLSWGASRDEVVALLAKTEHERHSLATGCHYPASYTFTSENPTRELFNSLAYPVIAKPARPLSSFKTAIARNPDDLARLVHRHADALPIVAQQFIPGGEESIHFCAVYLQGGRVVARFDGRKLRSRPMGHTTVAEPATADDVFAETQRFFQATGISGPASLELKRDEHNVLWVIEPTVGRSDFWLQVCISNGVNLPWIEYCDQAGLEMPAVAATASHIWVNTERDPKALGFVLAGMIRNSIRPRRLVLPYLSSGDPRPVWRATSSKIVRNLSARSERRRQAASRR